MTDVQPISPPRVIELRDGLHRITCQIKSSSDGRNFNATGTGFFFRFLFPNNIEVEAVVTNRHVLAGAQLISVRLVEDKGGEPRDGPGREVQFLPAGLIIFHPDPNVDLAIIPLGPLSAIASQQDWKVNAVFLTPELVPDDEESRDFAAASNVLMVGYPIGLIDPNNNLPVVRRGALSTPYWFDYCGRADCLVDIACFPGSSGSPVLASETGMVQTRAGVNLGQSRVKLLGVLYAGHTHNQTGTITALPIPTSTSVEVRQMVHLGIVVKAREILGFRPILQAIVDRELGGAAAN